LKLKRNLHNNHHNKKKAEPDEGINKDDIIMKITSSPPDLVSKEIQKLLEEGILYEPRPGRVRYLG
jgi:hypothetical protein